MSVQAHFAPFLMVHSCGWVCSGQLVPARFTYTAWHTTVTNLVELFLHEWVLMSTVQVGKDSRTHSLECPSTCTVLVRPMLAA